jgi:putative transposase
MKFYEEGCYHVYNRGNNKQKIFFSDNDYLHFLSLCKKYIVPRVNIMAWCLMPNHFHFILHTNALSLQPLKWGGNIMPNLSNGFQLLQNNYAKMVNKRECRTGSLFQQKTKSKYLETMEDAVNAFWYTHFNPTKAQLVQDPKDWHYSSFLDYMNLTDESICNKDFTRNFLALHDMDLKTNFSLTDGIVKRIF